MTTTTVDRRAAYDANWLRIANEARAAAAEGRASLAEDEEPHLGILELEEFADNCDEFRRAYNPPFDQCGCSLTYDYDFIGEEERREVHDALRRLDGRRAMGGFEVVLRSILEGSAYRVDFVTVIGQHRWADQVVAYQLGQQLNIAARMTLEAIRRGEA